jgi:EAL domain-containing protein (putative c-di-GMP-specific phosphodiesterase class I)
MLELRLRGVQFALDDFGTGYASLAYLVDLPFNRLKIDRSLVANEDDAHRRKVVRAVIALGHELGLAIVAEGIETAAQVSELTSQGCDYGQGWLYGASMLPAVAGELIGDV